MKTNKKSSVLLVDDDPGVRLALKRELESEGYIVKATGDVRLALDYLLLYQIDILITDQRMPSMRGDQLLEKAQQYRPEAIKIMLSGHTDFSAVTTSLNCGGLNAFVHKPWDRDELSTLMSDMLARRDQGHPPRYCAM